MTTLQTALTTATTVTSSAALVAGKHTPVDATSGAKTMTLPTPATVGARLRVEKVDASTNTVTISGTIRGGASSVALSWQYETIEMVAESLTSWRPASDHKPKAGLSSVYGTTDGGRPVSSAQALAAGSGVYAPAMAKPSRQTVATNDSVSGPLVNPWSGYVEIADGTVGLDNNLPSMTQLPDGTLLHIWRRAAAHTAVFPNYIMARKSDIRGNLTAEYQVLAGDATYDLRDPCVSTLADGSQLLTVTRQLISTGIAPANAVDIYRSTDAGATFTLWSGAINVGFTGTDFATMPVTRLPDGRLCLAWYGKNTGDTYSSVKAAFSSDNGVSWGSIVTVAAGTTRHWQEPQIVPVGGSELVCLIRSDSADFTIYTSRSLDNGATWSAPAPAFGGSSAPRAIVTSSGRVLVPYRPQVPQDATAGAFRNPVVRWSDDKLTTWSTVSVPLDLTKGQGSGATFVYAGMAEVFPGIVACTYAMESGNTGWVRMKYIADGGAVSPTGAGLFRALLASDGDISAPSGLLFARSVNLAPRSGVSADIPLVNADLGYGFDLQRWQINSVTKAYVNSAGAIRGGTYSGSRAASSGFGHGGLCELPGGLVVGGLTLPRRIITGATATMISSDGCVEINRAGGSTYTLLTATAAGEGRVLDIHALNPSTVAASGAETIAMTDGSTVATISLTAGQTLRLRSDGTTWRKVVFV